MSVGKLLLTDAEVKEQIAADVLRREALEQVKRAAAIAILENVETWVRSLLEQRRLERWADMHERAATFLRSREKTAPTCPVPVCEAPLSDRSLLSE